ncbi:hypothetical protein BX616_001227 [Lobosporangium transversale]|nr:hypothetical protein BX616_001227 [Lobosporangium transversale]
MNNDGKNIMEISEIASQIAQYLAPADLANACSVCSTWFVPFVSELWRSIKPDQWTHEAFRKALPRYSHYIRELRCAMYDRLDNIGPDCTRLTVFKAPVLYESISQGIIKDILKHNINIKELWLGSALPSENIDITIEFIQILAKLKELRHLSLYYFRVLPGCLEFLLEQLPNLESLHLGEWVEFTHPSLSFNIKTGLLQGSAEPSAVELEPRLQRPQLQNKISLQLRSLFLDGCQHSYVSILRIACVSPNLESISLSNSLMPDSLFLRMSTELDRFVDRLSSYCPRLECLGLNGIEIDLEGLACLLKAFPSLRRLDLEDVDIEDRHVLTLILRHRPYRQSLEEIRIYSQTGRFMGRLSSHAILWMLRRCPNLKKVSLRQALIEATELADLSSSNGLLEFAEINGDGADIDATLSENMPEGDIYYQDGVLVCRNLEILETCIYGPDKKWAPSEALVEDNVFSEYDCQIRQRLYDIHVGLDDSEDPESTTGSLGGSGHTSYELYEAVLNQLQTLPKLDMSYIRFDYHQ